MLATGTEKREAASYTSRGAGDEADGHQARPPCDPRSGAVCAAVNRRQDVVNSGDFSSGFGRAAEHALPHRPSATDPATADGFDSEAIPPGFGSATMMSDDRPRAQQILQRIATALGTDVTAFSAERGEKQGVHESLELLAAFESIVDVDDRRACLDFVRTVAARQRRI